MQIYINNKLAALKQGTSFEYVSENRLFTGSDGYTLTVTFPLKDCPQNQAIFGHINRADVAAQKAIFDCELRDKDFHKFGCITITEINEAEVKTQFLDGRSEQNFTKTLDKIYINELDLGEPPTTSKTEISPSDAWRGLDASRAAVALPWVNDSSRNLQNCIVCADGGYSWHPDIPGISWQPYLIYIAAKICEQIGYSYDFSAWEADEQYRYILVCNSLPYSWFTPQFARALPHWSVEEFFNRIELFLGCEFNFDHRAKRIAFAFTKDILRAKTPVRLDNIVEEYSTEVKVENDKCEYLQAKNIAYKDCSHQMWKYYSCDWFIKAWTAADSTVVRYGSLSQLLADNSWLSTWRGSNMRNSNLTKLLYAADVDTYFIIRAVSRTDTGERSFGGKVIIWEYKCVLQPVNTLGPRIVDDSDDAPQDEIDFVPACIDFTDDDNGFALFLPLSGDDDENSVSLRVGSNFTSFEDRYESMNSHFAQTRIAQALAAGEQDKKAEYYDRIFVAWWDGTPIDDNMPPHPLVENVIIRSDWSSYVRPHFSLRLNDRHAGRFDFAPAIEPTQKTTFKFIADKVPDVRAPFIIRGKRYVCEKLTATFTESGMSQLIKGVFYPVKDGPD